VVEVLKMRVCLFLFFSPPKDFQTLIRKKDNDNERQRQQRPLHLKSLSLVHTVAVAVAVIVAAHTTADYWRLGYIQHTFINMPATPILVEKTTVHPRQEEEPPQRIDSFPSLSMEGPSDDYITDDEHDLETGGQSSSSPSSSSSSLTEENERLRAQVAQLKDKVTALQNRSKHKRLKRANSETDVSVVLELSLPNLRQGRNPSHNASPNHNHNPKPRQSPPPKMNLESFPQQGKRVATHHDDNDRGMMEPQYLDLETHRSCDGLHHRSHYHPNNRVSQSQSLTPIKRKPKGLALLQLDDDDDPFPSKSANLEGDDDDNSDDDCEQDGLLTRTRSSSNENNIIINNDDDQEDFVTNLWDRAGWLVGLLVLQSMSSFILARNEALLQEHTIIVRFLTMLVGAGGNAGNQASVRGNYCGGDGYGYGCRYGYYHVFKVHCTHHCIFYVSCIIVRM
jgi:hypothetical protein